MRTIAALVISASAAAIVAQSAAPADVNARIDTTFARWTSTTPGCSVGASVDGQPALAKAYGMADLEHDVKNTPLLLGNLSADLAALFHALIIPKREGCASEVPHESRADAVVERPCVCDRKLRTEDQRPTGT